MGTRRFLKCLVYRRKGGDEVETRRLLCITFKTKSMKTRHPYISVHTSDGCRPHTQMAQNNPHH